MIFSLFWEGAFIRKGAFIRGGVYSRRGVYSRKYGILQKNPTARSQTDALRQ